MSTGSNNSKTKIPPPRRTAAIRKNLLEWFAASQRALPWRGGYEPYRVWISEIMLQQTQVAAVLPYFERWMERFPDVAAVARATEQAVLKMWEGLGYYSRARSLRLAARQVMKIHGGHLPASLEALRSLPGIGPYTAGAIASIAFNLPVPAVDGNVARVLGRLFALEEPVDSPAGQNGVVLLARHLLPPGEARDFNQSMMEVGALVCRPRNPACGVCPLRRLCYGRQTGDPAAFPRKRPRPPRRALAGVMALLENGGRVLLRKRPPRGLWGGLWEFPWLERDPGETGKAALARLLAELSGGTGNGNAPPPRRIGVVHHALTHLDFELTCFRIDIQHEPSRSAQPEGGRPRSKQSEPPHRRWVTWEELGRLPLGRINHKALRLYHKPAQLWLGRRGR